MAIYTVTIKSCRSPFRSRTTRVRAENADDALDRAVAKLWGARAFISMGYSVGGLYRTDPPSGGGWCATVIPGWERVVYEVARESAKRATRVIACEAEV